MTTAAWVANLYSRPPSLWITDGSVCVPGQNQAFACAAEWNGFPEWITGAHIVYTKGKPGIPGGIRKVHHQNVLTNFVTNSQAYYVQVGYRLPWLEKALKPYYDSNITHMPLSEQVLTNQDLVRRIHSPDRSLATGSPEHTHSRAPSARRVLPVFGLTT